MSLLHIAPSALAAELQSRDYGKTVKESDGGYFESLTTKTAVEIRHVLFSTANHQKDDRVDLSPNIPTAQWRNAEAVGLIVHESALTREGDMWRLRSPFRFEHWKGDGVPLCPGEKFADQPSVRDPHGYFGWSCCLVHSNAVLTCAHGNLSKIQEYRVVFGYHTLKHASRWEYVALEDVFEIDRVFAHYHYLQDKLSAGPDWALLILKRAPKRIAASVAPAPPREAVGRDEVYAIGHPQGLPMKICTDAYVRSTCIPGVFAAPLDTDEGNSGSPVFYQHRVVGIVNSQQDDKTTDYRIEERESGSCYARQTYGARGSAITCTRDDGSTQTEYVVGQLCTSSAAFFDQLKRLRAEYP